MASSPARPKQHKVYAQMPTAEVRHFAYFAAGGIDGPWGHRGLFIDLSALAYGHAAYMDHKTWRGHVLLLWAAWGSDPVGYVPADPKRLKRITRCKVTPEMLNGFELKGDHYYHDDLAYLAEKVQWRRDGRRTKARPALLKKTRFQVLNRDGFRCVYCGRGSSQTELVIDHRIPVAAGGTDDPENLFTACVDCNAGKSDRLITAEPTREAQ